MFDGFDSLGFSGCFTSDEMKGKQPEREKKTKIFYK